MDRVGIWTTALDALPVGAALEAAAEIEELGYGALWYGEAYGREALTTAALLLGATSRMTVATGIASIYGRDPMAAGAASRTLAAAYPGRFLLGLGVSHRPLVERVRGHTYDQPLAAMRGYLAAMDEAPYLVAGPPDRAPRVLAALGPRMLELARDAADGAHPYLVTPEHTAVARATLGPGKLLAVEQAAVLSVDPEVVARRAHAHLEVYTGLESYRASWGRQGFDDTDLARGGSDRLKAALVVAGDEAAVRARVEEHLAAGADHVCVQVLADDPFTVPREDWRRLAPALVG